MLFSCFVDIIEKSFVDIICLGFKVIVKGYVGDGNFYENIIYNLLNEEEMVKVK